MKFFRSTKDKDVPTLDLYFSRNNELPPVPFELKPYLSEGEWESRLLHIASIINRSRKPVLERVYVAFALTATIASPIILFSLLNNLNVSHTMPHSTVVKFRFVGLAVIIVIGLVLWLPFVGWRVLGTRRLRKVLATWENVDRARFQTTDVPRLYVRPPSIFRTMTLVRIITPNRTTSSQGSSNISAIPNLYYKNNPASASRAYFYPYNKPEKGMPRMSVVGGGFDYRTSVFKESDTKTPLALTRPNSTYQRTPTGNNRIENPKTPTRYSRPDYSKTSASPRYSRRESNVYGLRPSSSFRRAPGSEPNTATRQPEPRPEVSARTKEEYRTSTFYKEYFDEVNRKEALRTPIRGTMAGGRAATPLEMAVVSSDSEVLDDKW